MFRRNLTILFAISAIFVEPLCVDAANEVSSTSGEDPRVQLASQARQTIEAKERAVADSVGELLTQLDAAIQKMPSKTLEQEQLALTHLKGIATALREQAEAILSKREVYARNFESLQKALEIAPEMFRKAAETYREYAEEATFEDFRTAYTSLAESWDSLAAKTEERAKNARGPDVAEWEESCRYIAAIATFAKRLEEHLAAFPDTDWLNRQHELSEELKTLIRRFQKLQELLLQFNSKLTGQALARDLGKKSRPSSPSERRLANHLPERSSVTQPRVPVTSSKVHSRSVPPVPLSSTPAYMVYPKRRPQAASESNFEAFNLGDPLASKRSPTNQRFTRPQQPRTQGYYHVAPFYVVSYTRNR